MCMNRSMIMIKKADELSVFNPVRLCDTALSQLEELGNVRHILRLDEFHGVVGAPGQLLHDAAKPMMEAAIAKALSDSER